MTIRFRIFKTPRKGKSKGRSKSRKTIEDSRATLYVRLRDGIEIDQTVRPHILVNPAWWAPRIEAISEFSECPKEERTLINADYKNLNAVSNGVSAIQTEYTQKVVVSTNPVTLKYKFMPFIDQVYTNADKYSKDYPYVGETKVCNDIAETDNDQGVIVSLGAPSGNFGAAIASWEVADSDEGTDMSRTITITPTVSSTAGSKQQDIIITGRAITKDGSGSIIGRTTITRKVTIVVVGTFSMEVSCTPGSVAEKNTLTPYNDELPVSSGKSLFDSTKPGYHFVKTVDYATYKSSNVIPCSFKTNTAASATDIIVTNEYFTSGTAELLN